MPTAFDDDDDDNDDGQIKFLHGGATRKQGNSILIKKTGLVSEIEPIQTQMAQKPVLRAEVYARTLRARQNV